MSLATQVIMYLVDVPKDDLFLRAMEAIETDQDRDMSKVDQALFNLCQPFDRDTPNDGRNVYNVLYMHALSRSCIAPDPKDEAVLEAIKSYGDTCNLVRNKFCASHIEQVFEYVQSGRVNELCSQLQKNPENFLSLGELLSELLKVALHKRDFEMCRNMLFSVNEYQRYLVFGVVVQALTVFPDLAPHMRDDFIFLDKSSVHPRDICMVFATLLVEAGAGGGSTLFSVWNSCTEELMPFIVAEENSELLEKFLLLLIRRQDSRSLLKIKRSFPGTNLFTNSVMLELWSIVQDECDAVTTHFLLEMRLLYEKTHPVTTTPTPTPTPTPVPTQTPRVWWLEFLRPYLAWSSIRSSWVGTVMRAVHRMHPPVLPPD